MELADFLEQLDLQAGRFEEKRDRLKERLAARAAEPYRSRPDQRMHRGGPRAAQGPRRDGERPAGDRAVVDQQHRAAGHRLRSLELEPVPDHGEAMGRVHGALARTPGPGDQEARRHRQAGDLAHAGGQVLDQPRPARRAHGDHDLRRSG
jgi:hypothetical protein